jgi:enterochelin esterase-like enzyme
MEQEDYMKKGKIILLFMLLGVLLLFFGCGQDPAVSESRRDGHLEELTVKSLALADKDGQEPVLKTIYVFLPPNYDTSQDRYPVIYYLHGHAADSSELLGFEEPLYRAMEQGGEAPFILVAVNGDNKLGGSFYVNAKNGGRWEDHFIQELLPLIDRRYRTLSSAQSRGLMGFSMGGFGVLRLGLAHPELFSAVWALCPGVFVPGKGLIEAIPHWRRFGGGFMESYAAAFSKEAKIPQLDGSAEDQAVVAEWEAGFGGWETRIASYKQQSSKLRGIRIIYGEADMFTWITEGSKYLADFMQKQGIPVELQGYAIGHTIRAGTVKDDALPFFRQTLLLR